VSEGQTRLAPPEGIGALRRQRLDWAQLYFVCDARQAESDLEELLRAALSGGAGIVQLRDKEAEREALVRAGHTFKRLAEGYGALFIVNDDPSLASELQADGVHLGQEDLDPGEARRLLDADAVIGLSTHSPEQFDAAQKAGVDYLSAGPVWATPTKQGRPAAGLQLIEHATRRSKLPFFAIGGIDSRNVGEVSAAGATRICVVRAIRDADDPRAAAAALRAAVDPEAGE
jgi:thiamine-phosphate pyrophosphorylase